MSLVLKGWCKRKEGQTILFPDVKEQQRTFIERKCIFCIFPLTLHRSQTKFQFPEELFIIRRGDSFICISESVQIHSRLLILFPFLTDVPSRVCVREKRQKLLSVFFLVRTCSFRVKVERAPFDCEILGRRNGDVAMKSYYHCKTLDHA